MVRNCVALRPNMICVMFIFGKNILIHRTMDVVKFLPPYVRPAAWMPTADEAGVMSFANQAVIRNHRV